MSTVVVGRNVYCCRGTECLLLSWDGMSTVVRGIKTRSTYVPVTSQTQYCNIHIRNIHLGVDTFASASNRCTCITPVAWVAIYFFPGQLRLFTATTSRPRPHVMSWTSPHQTSPTDHNHWPLHIPVDMDSMNWFRFTQRSTPRGSVASRTVNTSTDTVSHSS